MSKIAEEWRIDQQQQTSEFLHEMTTAYDSLNFVMQEHVDQWNSMQCINIWCWLQETNAMERNYAQKKILELIVEKCEKDFDFGVQYLAKFLR